MSVVVAKRFFSFRDYARNYAAGSGLMYVACDQLGDVIDPRRDATDRFRKLFDSRSVDGDPRAPESDPRGDVIDPLRVFYDPRADSADSRLVYSHGKEVDKRALQLRNGRRRDSWSRVARLSHQVGERGDQVAALIEMDGAWIDAPGASGTDDRPTTHAVGAAVALLAGRIESVGEPIGNDRRPMRADCAPLALLAD